MGKGYNNYMTKKPFHPGSKANIKRTWMAEQRTENEKRKQEELKTQYDKEQDLYNNRALLSTESKEKLQLNFMYEAPPGAKRERQKEDDEPEYKFEWQRKYNAPREDYAKGNAEIRDQPFGIPVRNVRCIKCHKWGHINTDRECPLYTHASSSSMPTTTMDPLELMRQMREDGFDLKKSALGHQIDPKKSNEQFIQSEESDPEINFIKTLTPKEKKKLLKKLNKLSKKQKRKAEHDKKKSKKKKSKKKSSDSDSESEGEKKIEMKIKQEKFTSESEEDEEELALKERKAKSSSETAKHHKIKHEKVQKSELSKTEGNFKKRPLDTAGSGEAKNDKKMEAQTEKKSEKLPESKSSQIDSTQLDKSSKAVQLQSNKSSSDTSDEEGEQKKRKKKSPNDELSKPKKKVSLDVPKANIDECSSDYPDKHPDGYDPEFPHHSAPSSRNESFDTDQDNALHDRFRRRHRHRRSPSVKQKYRKD